MRFTDDQVLRVCSSILSRWKKDGLLRPKAADDAILSRMAAEFQRDLRREEDLDREVEGLLDQHLAKIEGAQANRRVLFQKIKERLARERDIVL
ncbi:MAG: hypothetical protein OHK0028_20570 [Deltaproteobacteria bacterium]